MLILMFVMNTAMVNYAFNNLIWNFFFIKLNFFLDQTRLSVWVLDGDPGHANLLKFALNEETYTHTLVILTVAMTTPWGILDQLQNWASILADHIDTLKIGSDVRQQCRFVCASD